MGLILHFNFIGARAFRERKVRGLKGGVALVILERDLVTDCDEKAWLDGVRPGDTLRQAKIASPACQVVRLRGLRESDGLKEILDALSRISPYIEPSADGSGVFAAVAPGQFVQLVPGLLSPAREGFSQAFIGEGGSRLVAKASSDWLFREYAGNRKVLPGKTAWGKIEWGDGYFLASVDEGKEKAFLSGATLDSLWPAPPEILSTLRSLGLKKVRDIREVPLVGLARHIGDWAFPVKEWAEGEDRSPVKALYPPPCLVKEVSFQEPVPLSEALFEPALRDIASELVEKGIGFKAMQISISGDFPGLFRERKFVRPVSSFEAMRNALGAALGEFSRKEGAVLSCPVVSVFALRLDEIAPVQAKPVSLIAGGTREVRTAVPVALALAISGIEQKFGDEAVNWGRADDLGMGGRPEIARREKMLSMWDPMRPDLQLLGLEGSGCPR
jgi:hypothetical protein